MGLVVLEKAFKSNAGLRGLSGNVGMTKAGVTVHNQVQTLSFSAHDCTDVGANIVGVESTTVSITAPPARIGSAYNVTAQRDGATLYFVGPFVNAPVREIVNYLACLCCGSYHCRSP